MEMHIIHSWWHWYGDFMMSFPFDCQAFVSYAVWLYDCNFLPTELQKRGSLPAAYCKYHTCVSIYFRFQVFKSYDCDGLVIGISACFFFFWRLNKFFPRKQTKNKTKNKRINTWVLMRRNLSVFRWKTDFSKIVSHCIKRKCLKAKCICTPHEKTHFPFWHLNTVTNHYVFMHTHAIYTRVCIYVCKQISVQ